MKKTLHVPAFWQGSVYGLPSGSCCTPPAPGVPVGSALGWAGSEVAPPGDVEAPDVAEGEAVEPGVVGLVDGEGCADG